MRATVFRALALGLPSLLAQVTTSSTGYCIEPEPVKIVSLNAAFLALKQLAVNGCGKEWPAAYWGDVDFDCRVAAMAPGLLRGDYDIIVLNEVFEEEAKAGLWLALHNKYPYVVYRLEGDYFQSARDDSGLMLFSKWPFVDPAFNPRDCMPAVEGTSIKADFNGEWKTEDAKDYIGFRSFADNSGWDSCATKGVGYVRLRSPAGRNYNVFFTHLQADYGWNEREIRHNQLETIRWLQECVAPTSLIENHDAFIIAGDMNINGDLSNPYPGATKHSRIEYDWNLDVLNDQPQPYNAHPIFKTTFHDAWAKYMTPPSCLTHEQTDPYRPTCYAGSDPLNPLEVGAAPFDRGFTFSALSQFASEERLDYVFLHSKNVGSSSPATIPDQEICGAHLTRGYNLLKRPTSGEGSEGGDFGGLTGQRVGIDPVSDHVGLNAELNHCTRYASPYFAGALVPKLAQNATLDYAGAYNWFRIDTPGTYTFKVIPLNPAVTMKYWVYEPTELSRPVVVYHGESQYSPEVPPSPAGGPGQEAFTGSVFKVLGSPFYVKVSGDGPTNYRVLAHRNECTTIDEACAIDPYESAGFPDKTRETWAGPSASDRYFKIHVSRSDTPGFLQTVGIYTGQQNNYIDLVEVLKKDTQGQLSRVGNLAATKSSATLESGRYVIRLQSSGADPEHLDPEDGDDAEYFIHLRRDPALVIPDGGPPPDFDYWVGWETNLTWLFGTALGGDPLVVSCKEQQELSEDEIWMEVIPEFWDTTKCLGQSKADIDVWEVASNFEEGDSNVSWEGAWLGSYVKNTRGELYRDLKAYRFTNAVTLMLYEDDHGDDCSDDERSACRLFVSDLPRGPGNLRIDLWNSYDCWQNWIDGEADYSGYVNIAYTRPHKRCSYVGDPACEAPATCDLATRHCQGGN